MKLIAIIMKLFVNYLLKFTGKDNSKEYKIFSLVVGAVFFLTILPAMFIVIGFVCKNHVRMDLNRVTEVIISFAGIIIGLYYLIWATVTQWKIGKGTPAPNAPTQNLIITGPYRYCRNPIEFGAIIYYLGIGTLAGGIIVGIISCVSGFVAGSIYHKFIEEKELEKRFGEEYI
jgi:protein-S-isoprenylcysteine O-methyltransferase Ste14